MVRTAGLHRVYHLGGQEVRALDGLDLEVGRGEYVRIVGASGFGKPDPFSVLGRGTVMAWNIG